MTVDWFILVSVCVSGFHKWPLLCPSFLLSCIWHI